MSDIGTGATLTLDNFAANIISINHSGVERESVPTSHLGTLVGRTFLPGDLYDPGEFEIAYQVDTEDPAANTSQPPYDGDAVTVTVKLPIKPGSGDSTPAQVSASGFVTSASPLSIEVEGLITGSMTVKLSGALAWANAS